MSVAAALTLSDAAQIIRQAVRDKTYRRHPVGLEVGRFLRALRWEDRSPGSIDQYEIVLAKLTLDHADFDSLDRFASPVGTEYLREFLDRHWGDLAPATRENRLAIVRSFFKWAFREGKIQFDPTAAIRPPRRRKVERVAYPRETLIRLLAAQDSLRDQCALGLLIRLGLRKNDLRLLQIRDVDLTRNLVSLRHGKGGKVSVLPLVAEDVREDLYLHIVGERRGPDEYLLYPHSRRLEPMTPSAVHYWFKRCLGRAGLPAAVKMHELRHSAADEVWRVTGNIVLASELLRHESVGTTQLYLHPSREDLAAGLRAVDEAWRGGRE